MSKDKLRSDVLLLNPSHRCPTVGRPGRNYIQQLHIDTGGGLEDLLKAMDDTDGLHERLSEVYASSST